MKHQISIIIPTLNEAKNIGRLLKHLVKNSSKEHIAEIIVVDGGSADGTQDLVKKIFGIELELSGRAQSRPLTDSEIHSAFEHQTKLILLDAPKGRAKQMNFGAKNVKGSILYFLHADSFPPKHFDKHIISEVKKGNKAGCFRMKFRSDHWWLKLASVLTALPLKSCRGGDQSLFITQQLFNSIGGYNETYTIYEDNVLIRELYNRNQFIVIPKWLTTSARRYHSNGIWRLQFHFWAIHLKKWLGASPEKLNQYYLKYVSVKK